jgi:cytochrome c biogenesis protein CcdA
VFSRTKSSLWRVISGCKSVYKRWRELVSKLIKNPLFPVLFITEFVKVYTLEAVNTGIISALLVTNVQVLLVAAIISTIVWLFAEVVLKEAKEYADEVDV